MRGMFGRKHGQSRHLLPRIIRARIFCDLAISISELAGLKEKTLNTRPSEGKLDVTLRS